MYAAQNYEMDRKADWNRSGNQVQRHLGGQAGSPPEDWEKREETEMAEKKRLGRRAYLNNFKKSGKGEYVYEGAHYRFVGEERERMRLTSTLAWLSAALVALLLAEGCLPVPGLSRTAYVLLPYVAELAGAVSACIAAWRLRTAEFPLRDYVYESSVEKLSFRSGVAAAGGAAALVGETVYLFLAGSGGATAWIAGFYIVQLLALIAALQLYRANASAQWEKL